MKVKEIMKKTIVSVDDQTPLKEVGRILFGLGFSAVPVIKEQKLVGIITQQDILSRLFPSVKDFIEDYVHAQNFEAMEENLKDFLEMSASTVMSKNITAATAETPIMRAQSMMLVQKFSHLPVIDENQNLVGIVSQGDIFRALLKEEIPRLEQERYADFVAGHYDLMVNWQKRLAFELPLLFRLFRKEKVKAILDLGVWTGEYTLNLALKGGYQILGLDHNPIMIKMCEEKRNKLPAATKEKLVFLLTDFADFSKNLNQKFDAAICMGNALVYIPVSPFSLFKETRRVLSKKGLFVLQIFNLEKILRAKKRLISFHFQPAGPDNSQEHLFVEFFDRQSGDFLLHRLIIFASDGKNWLYKGITSLPIRFVKEQRIKTDLKKAGFAEIKTSGNSGEYQGEYGPLSFNQPFSSLTSDWLNVVAKC